MKTSREQTQQTDKATQNHRQILIRDAILGMIRRYPQDGVFLLPTLDMLALYFQAPVMLTFWVFDRRAPRCLLSSVENPLLIGHAGREFPPHEIPPFKSDCGDTPKRVRNVVFLPSHDGRIVALVVQPRHDSQKDAVDLTKQLLNLFSDQSFWEEFRGHLSKGIDSAPERWSDLIAEHREGHANALKKASELIGEVAQLAPLNALQSSASVFGDYDAVSVYFQEFEQAIDEVLRAKSNFKPLNHPGPSNDCEFPNLHFCVSSALPTPKWRAGEYPFTARLLLTEHQREMFVAYLHASQTNALLDACEKKLRDEFADQTLSIDRIMEFARRGDSAALLSHLQIPLLGDSTASADSPFTSGIVSFGSSPGKSVDKATTPSDLERQFAESVLYYICRPKDGGAHIFHIPMHVNGVAWIDAFTFTEDKPETQPADWKHNYLLYRDIITEIGSVIRNAAERIYLQVISDLVWRAWNYQSPEVQAVVDALNRQALLLALSVPFPWVTLSASRTDDCSKMVPKRLSADVFVGVAENPFFVRRVTFKTLELDEIAERVVRSAQNANDSFALTHSRSLANTAHIMGGGIDAIRASLQCCEGKGVEEIRLKARKMERLAATVRAMVKGLGKVAPVNYNEVIDLVTQEAESAEIKLEQLDGLDGSVALRTSTDYLEVVFETCFSNIRKHASERSVNIALLSDGRVIWARFDSQTKSTSASQLNVSAMNSGAFDGLGINTLHVACLHWFEMRPRFQVVEQGHDIAKFIVELPIAYRI